MMPHERRQRPRPSGDPLRDDRAALTAAIRAAAGPRDGALCAALAAYAKRARTIGLELSAVVAEFRSVFDRSLPRNPADIGHGLRRELLVTRLVAAFHAGPPQ